MNGTLPNRVSLVSVADTGTETYSIPVSALTICTFENAVLLCSQSETLEVTMDVSVLLIACELVTGSNMPVRNCGQQVAVEKITLLSCPLGLACSAIDIRQEITDLTDRIREVQSSKKSILAIDGTEPPPEFKIPVFHTTPDYDPFGQTAFK